jgi:hypothetical protein
LLQYCLPVAGDVMEVTVKSLLFSDPVQVPVLGVLLTATARMPGIPFNLALTVK